VHSRKAAKQLPRTGSETQVLPQEEQRSLLRTLCAYAACVPHGGYSYEERVCDKQIRFGPTNRRHTATMSIAKLMEPLAKLSVFENMRGRKLVLN
jgi:hypothetical protein